MKRHDDFCGKLADYMTDDCDPEDPRNNDDISTFSLHPVNGSYELTEDTLLGKDDIHFKDLHEHYLPIMKRQLQDLYEKEER